MRVAFAGAHIEHVIDEIELDAEHIALPGNRPGIEPAGGDIERDVPGVVEPGRQRQPYFADHLRP